MQGDGTHQPLVNELRYLHRTVKTQKEVLGSSLTPKPRLPISKQAKHHVLGKEFILEIGQSPDPKTQDMLREGEGDGGGVRLLRSGQPRGGHAPLAKGSGLTSSYYCLTMAYKIVSLFRGED